MKQSKTEYITFSHLRVQLSSPVIIDVVWLEKCTLWITPKYQTCSLHHTMFNTISIGIHTKLYCTGKGFPLSSSVFPCQKHFTMALHSHISPGRYTTGSLVAAFQRSSLTPSTWTTTTSYTTSRIYSVQERSWLSSPSHLKDVTDHSKSNLKRKPRLGQDHKKASQAKLDKYKTPN
jgi:hypothetical protein